MKKLLQIIISKWTFKVIFVVLFAVSITAFFVSDIQLSTGNDTLIGTDTQTYKDNYDYQKSFGTDPVMIVFDASNQAELLSYESFDTMNNIVESVKYLDGVKFVNSPIGVVDFAIDVAYKNYQGGLYEMSSALMTISDNLNNMSFNGGSLDPNTLLRTFESLSLAQEELSDNYNNQIVIFENMKLNVSNEIIRLENIKETLNSATDQARKQSVTQTIQILVSISSLYDELILMNNNFSDAAANTSVALNQISSELMTMFSTITSAETSLSSLSLNLENMGLTLNSLAANFNMFIGTFPSSSDSLEMVVYPNGEISPMIEMFVIDDTHIYMSIILEESVTNNEINLLLQTINETLEETIHSDALVSGKPVLDYDIQTSMMDSMKIMMISAGIIMVVILLILFPVNFRLLPLFIVILAVLTTVGIMGLFSIPLTMVSMAVFPVLIGLGIDYSIQFHNRYMEEDLGGAGHE